MRRRSCRSRRGLRAPRGDAAGGCADVGSRVPSKRDLYRVEAAVEVVAAGRWDWDDGQNFAHCPRWAYSSAEPFPGVGPRDLCLFEVSKSEPVPLRPEPECRIPW